jgi:hypothetical protein
MRTGIVTTSYDVTRTPFGSGAWRNLAARKFHARAVAKPTLHHARGGKADMH